MNASRCKRLGARSEPQASAVVLLVLCLALFACKTYSLVSPGTHEIGDFYSVQSTIPWSKAKIKDTELWTIEGPFLQSLRFTHGTADGQPLFPVPGEKGQQLLYRSSMSETEIMELVVDTLARLQNGSVLPSGLEPTPFGARQGFRFEVEYLTPEGLPCKGIAVGTVADDKLYLILYTGARDHYFDRYAPRVEEMIGSIRLL
jgi:hypothetical protein